MQMDGAHKKRAQHKSVISCQLFTAPHLPHSFFLPHSMAYAYAYLFLGFLSFSFFFFFCPIKLQLHSLERKRRGAYGFDSIRSYRIYFAYALGQINLRQTHRLIFLYIFFF